MHGAQGQLGVPYYGVPGGQPAAPACDLHDAHGIAELRALLHRLRRLAGQHPVQPAAADVERTEPRRGSADAAGALPAAASVRASAARGTAASASSLEQLLPAGALHGGSGAATGVPPGWASSVAYAGD